MMKHKFEVLNLVKSFVFFVENQFNCTIKCIKSDNRPKFNLVTFQYTGIIHQKSCVETLQKNRLGLNGSS